MCDANEHLYNHNHDLSDCPEIFDVVDTEAKEEANFLEVFMQVRHRINKNSVDILVPEQAPSIRSVLGRPISGSWPSAP